MGKNLCLLLEPCKSGYGIRCCKECNNLNKCIENNIRICKNVEFDCTDCLTPSSEEYVFLSKLSNIVSKVQNENIDKIEIGKDEYKSNSYNIYLLKDDKCLYSEIIDYEYDLECLIEQITISLQEIVNEGFIIQKALPDDFSVFEKIINDNSRNCKVISFKKGLHKLDDEDYVIFKFKISRIDKDSVWDIPFEELINEGFIPRNIDNLNGSDTLTLIKKHKKERFL